MRKTMILLFLSFLLVACSDSPVCYYYLGRFEKLPEDGKACQLTDIYQQEVLAKNENGYQGLALLMDTVEMAGAKGVFVNKEAIENFFSRLEK